MVEGEEDASHRLFRDSREVGDRSGLLDKCVLLHADDPSAPTLRTLANRKGGWQRASPHFVLASHTVWREASFDIWKLMPNSRII